MNARSARFSTRASAALGAAAVVVLGLALPAAAETFAEAGQKALATHPNLAADRSTVKAADEAVYTARSNFLPNLNLNAEINTDHYTRAAGPLDLFGRQVGVEGTQLVFDGFTTAARYDAAVAERDALKADADTNINTVLLDVARAYISVVRDRKTLESARRNLDEHRHSVSRLVGIVKLDPGKEFDLVQVRARESFAASQVEQARAALQQSESTYREVVGSPPGQLSMPPLLSGAGFESLDAALKLGQEVHPNVVAATQRQLERTANRRDVYGQASPRVDLVARYVRGEDIAAISGRDDEAYAGVRASYGLPIGLGNVTNIRNAQNLEEAAKQKVNASKRDVREGVRAAWAQRQGLISAMPMVNDYLKRSIAVVEGFKTQYTLGRRTILDLLIVQNDAYVADTHQIELDADRVLIDYTLAAQEGILARFVPAPVEPKPAVVPLKK